MLLAEKQETVGNLPVVDSEHYFIISVDLPEKDEVDRFIALFLQLLKKVNQLAEEASAVLDLLLANLPIMT